MLNTFKKFNRVHSLIISDMNFRVWEVEGHSDFINPVVARGQ